MSTRQITYHVQATYKHLASKLLHALKIIIFIILRSPNFLHDSIKK